MISLSNRLTKILKLSATANLTSLFGNAAGVQGGSKLFYSTGSFDSDDDNKGNNDGGAEIEDDDFLPERPELQAQSVDPRKGWNYRGVHKAIICGKIGQSPVQKILRNGRTITIFTVGTGGMFDQRITDAKDLPKPAQWHRIAVHNEALGAYAVKQLVKNSSVYVEGDIETESTMIVSVAKSKAYPKFVCAEMGGFGLLEQERVRRIFLLMSSERG